jgi:hypothetical protein
MEIRFSENLKFKKLTKMSFTAPSKRKQKLD